MFQPKINVSFNTNNNSISSFNNTKSKQTINVKGQNKYSKPIVSRLYKKQEYQPKVSNINTNNPEEDEMNCSTANFTSEEKLFEILNELSSEDDSERINAIIIIHEILCTKYLENKFILIPNIDKIITIFTEITRNLFGVENIENISIKFAKYLVTILCKVAYNKKLIMNLGFNILYSLIYELLNIYLY